MEDSPKSSIRATPLWVISLFLSLTEAIAGIAATQVSGKIQVAFVAFALAFPTLVAAAFFIILWNRPYVLYPPGEFRGTADVTSYVQAMSHRVEADVEVQAANVRAAVKVETDALGSRMGVLEEGFRSLLETQESTRGLLTTFEAKRQASVDASASEKTSFEQNGERRIVVVSLEGAGDALSAPYERAKELAKMIGTAGFSTAVRGWNKDYYLIPEQRSWLPETAVIIHRGDHWLAGRLKSILGDLLPSMPVVVLTVEEAVTDSVRTNNEQLLDQEFDAAIVLCRPRAA